MTTHKQVRSLLHLVSWGAARKTASEKREKRAPAFPRRIPHNFFSLTVFRTTPWLTKRLEEATTRGVGGVSIA